ncbi:MAG: hypothetical protein M1114_06140 [Candidatus Dependentiae bacterium]|nr:hypothetical protein [Candidatus Dependentiae bacterium]
MNLKKIIFMSILCVASKQVLAADIDDIATPRANSFMGIIRYPRSLPKDFLRTDQSVISEEIDLACEDTFEFSSLFSCMIAQFEKNKAFILARLASRDEYLENSRDASSKKEKLNIHYLSVPKLHSYFFGKGKLLPEPENTKLKNIFDKEKEYSDVHYFITYPTKEKKHHNEHAKYTFNYVGSARSLLNGDAGERFLPSNLFLTYLLHFHYSKDEGLVTLAADQLRDTYSGEIDLGATNAPNEGLANYYDGKINFYVAPAKKEKDSKGHCEIQ